MEACRSYHVVFIDEPGIDKPGIDKPGMYRRKGRSLKGVIPAQNGEVPTWSRANSSSWCLSITSRIPPGISFCVSSLLSFFRIMDKSVEDFGVKMIMLHALWIPPASNSLG